MALFVFVGILRVVLAVFFLRCGTHLIQLIETLIEALDLAPLSLQVALELLSL